MSAQEDIGNDLIVTDNDYDKYMLIPKTKREKKKRAVIKKTSAPRRSVAPARTAVKKRSKTKIQQSRAGSGDGLREFARGQECTLRFSGICCRDNSTVVLAHVTPPRSASMGSKPYDIMGIHACYKCHWLIDGGHTELGISRTLIDAEIFKALYETQMRVINAGISGVLSSWE